jgi:phosphoribosylformylglycinamidine synthase
VDVTIHRALGLTDDEERRIQEILGRKPNHLELAMYAVMWSEHCSYKSSRVHLARLPTEGPQVLVGPGENAGVVDVGGGVAIALRIESHNHPSAIEPYQGAATGVGGILRDIFTMGARPVAIMDPLRFGTPGDARSRWIATGVVSGISGYGNSVGVPTVGGEIVFDDCYADNPLVNVLCMGVLSVDRLVLGRASEVGDLAVLLGATTGRDGIGGVSVLASAGFGDAGEEESKRPNVQVGDPFEEKRLIEACLELIDHGLVAGIQDLGGAGLTCATSETASRGGTGMDVDVSAVPLREDGMAPFEVMTSESQERMLAIIRPDAVDEVMRVCETWDVTATVVGRVTPPAEQGGRLRVLDGWKGPALADVPAPSLHDDAPKYDRPMVRPADLDARQADDPGGLAAPADCGPDLIALLMDTSWVFSQYDHQLFLNTVCGPGQDAALLRLKAPGVGSRLPERGVALSTDGNGRWCALDPRLGTALVVAESALNVACVGARPLALVNCLNLGNPEHAEVMWQLSECVDGMTDACLALGIPVVGGNVSLYNESRGHDIDPTPVIGMVGIVDRLERRPPGATLRSGSDILLLGSTAPPGLGGSLWALKLRGHRGGRLEAVDFALHSKLLSLVAELVAGGLAEGVHDVSDGGLGVALAEMAVGSATGFRIAGIEGHAGLFGESPSRVVLCVAPARRKDVERLAVEAGLEVEALGKAGGNRLTVDGLADVGLGDAVHAWRRALPDALGVGAFEDGNGRQRLRARLEG